MKAGNVSILVATTLALLGGCGGTSPKSATPITSRTASVHLVAALLRVGDFASIPGAPSQAFVQQRIDRVQLTVDPDPRAPCGAKLTGAPNLQAGALAVFASPAGTTIIDWVNRLAPGRATDLMRQQRADATTGCPDYQSLTSSGTEQSNHFLGTVPLPPAVAQNGFAYLVRAREAGGLPLYAVSLSLQRARCFMNVLVFAVRRPTRLFIEGMATEASRRLYASEVLC